VGEALASVFRISGKMPARSEAALGFVAALLPESTSLFEAVERIRRWRHGELRVESGSDSQGVRLMTVHGAKGLEFRHVFLVDTLRASPRAQPPVRRGGPGLFGVRWKEKREPSEDSIYKTLAEAAKNRDAEESRRILYVALTRARETLTLSLPRPEAKFPKDTWGEWLQKTVSVLEGEGTNAFADL
jgi:ATP-dependent helicase/nuclease subunit A